MCCRLLQLTIREEVESVVRLYHQYQKRPLQERPSKMAVSMADPDRDPTADQDQKTSAHRLEQMQWLTDHLCHRTEAHMVHQEVEEATHPEAIYRGILQEVLRLDRTDLAEVDIQPEVEVGHRQAL